MFLEASVAHLMTGDPAALLTAAERARALSAGTEPAVELLATAVIGEAQIALGEVEQGVAELRACEPYLMEADPLSMVEIVGMAGHAWTWVEDWDRATRTLQRIMRVHDGLGARGERSPGEGELREERRVGAMPEHVVAVAAHGRVDAAVDRARHHRRSPERWRQHV